jgi:hypothetical protein
MEVDVDDLAEWLRLKARIHDRIIGKTVQTLEDLEVFEVCDLLVLRGIRPLNEVFAEVTAKKISDALTQLSLSGRLVVPHLLPCRRLARPLAM